MQIAILSDIHGNLEAFQAVVESIEQNMVDKVICLGDIIGYGPDPEQVVQLFMEKNYFSVLGNHEAALTNKKMRNWFNFQAKENSEHTEKLLSPESLEYCHSLDTTASIDNMLFVHGFPPDSVLRYVTLAEEKELQSYFLLNSHSICFVGHSHDLLMFSWSPQGLEKQILRNTTYTLEKSKKYIINAGSVGQPRDGDNRAKYILFDTESCSFKVIYVDYDFEITIKKIKQIGFPEAYGLRLR